MMNHPPPDTRHPLYTLANANHTAALVSYKATIESLREAMQAVDHIVLYLSHDAAVLEQMPPERLREATAQIEQVGAALVGAGPRLSDAIKLHGHTLEEICEELGLTLPEEVPDGR